jgi:ubiquinone/menaquinone biosynthesis C-methylase UbiE
MQYCPFLRENSRRCLTEAYYQTIFALIKPYLNSSTTLLDIGCGLGRVVFDTAKENIQKAVGIDTSEAFISECNKIADNQSQYIDYHVPTSQISFRVADAQNLPFSTGEFNFITCLNVIDRVPKPQKVVQEIEKLLASGGNLLIADPYDWQEEYTPSSEQIENMYGLFNKSSWAVLTEIDGLPFTLQVNARKTVSYDSHLLFLKRL